VLGDFESAGNTGWAKCNMRAAYIRRDSGSGKKVNVGMW